MYAENSPNGDPTTTPSFCTHVFLLNVKQTYFVHSTSISSFLASQKVSIVPSVCRSCRKNYIKWIIL